MPATSPHRLLLLDAGNTRTKYGVFSTTTQTGEPSGLPVCESFGVVDNNTPLPWDELRPILGDAGGFTACFAGSNPIRIEELQQTYPADWPIPRPVPDRAEFPLVIDVDRPDKVGVDRLFNAVAANRLRKPGQAAVLIDSGTATTVDYVAADGRFCGGSILPGFELCARALHQYTARLPLVPLEPMLQSPPPDLGRNTEAAIRSGLYWGHVGAVKELLRRMMQRGAEDAVSDAEARHLGNITHDETPLVLLTGGAAPLLEPHLPSFCRSEPHLPLQGLAIVVG